jgi:phage-related baseplate assembly protein
VSGSPHVDGTRVDVAVTADSVRPAGDRIRVHRDASVTFVIRATAPGELHVHSTPEQQIAYPRGTSVATVRLHRPGVVDVESHTLDRLVVQLEVR